jgi:cyclic-di-GMP phosphodiesterase TipF (flagellum assembly factor)
MERGGERWWRRDGAWQAGASVLAAGCAAGALGAALLGGGPSGSLILHALALAGLAAALHQARRATAWSEKVSAEIDAFSARLIGLESRLAAGGDRAAAPALRSSVAEVTGEIALLGNLVRDLAVTVSAQDRELADLRAGFERVAEDLAARPATPPGGMRATRLRRLELLRPGNRTPGPLTPELRMHGSPKPACRRARPPRPGLRSPSLAPAPSWWRRPPPGSRPRRLRPPAPWPSPGPRPRRPPTPAASRRSSRPSRRTGSSCTSSRWCPCPSARCGSTRPWRGFASRTTP